GQPRANRRRRLMPRRLPADWYPGELPDNILVDATAYVGSSQSFTRFHSRQPAGLALGRGAFLGDGAILDVGPEGQVVVGEFALITSACIICDCQVRIDAYAMIAWNAV